MKQSESETSILTTHRLLQSTIDQSQYFDANNSIIIKADHAKLQQSRVQVEPFMIQDSLEELMEAQTAHIHVKRVQLLMEETKKQMKDARTYTKEYKEGKVVFEYKALKELGDILYDYTLSFQNLKNGFYVDYHKQQAENVCLQQQLNREVVEIQDVFERSKSIVQRIEELKFVLGRYKGQNQPNNDQQQFL